MINITGIYIFLFGLIIGSFLNVCIYRIPKKFSIVFPPSACPACNHKIKPTDNIPILSYILLLGRCRYCKKRISLRYPLVELLNAVLYIAVFNRFGLNFDGIFYMALMSTLIVITFIDIDHMIIQDEITIPGIIIALLAGMIFLTDPVIYGNNLGVKGAIIGFLAGGGLFLFISILSRGGMGGGDIKLMALFGACLGWKAVLMITFLGSLFGSIYGIILMIFKGKGRKTPVPFGPFLAVGAIICILYGRELLALYLGHNLIKL
ncbi:MAG: prepilin peptidase [Nitrospirae bacterium]|nr:prepilin peptidase [Nitrospirota bacterium]